MAQPENNLYAAGWRQGTFFHANLTICITTESGAIHNDHDFWVVSSQDCDLASTAVDSEDLIEIRPIYQWEQSLPMSIRNRRFPIVQDFCVDWRAAKCSVPARSLNLQKAEGSPTTRHRRYFKTWLGRGYDRPAVPVPQVPLAEAVATVVTKLKKREIDQHVRDVLMAFKGTDPQYVDLYAVVLQDHASEIETVGMWLNDVAIKVGERGFTVGKREARPESEISLIVLENTYAANLSDITTRDEERTDKAE